MFSTGYRNKFYRLCLQAIEPSSTGYFFSLVSWAKKMIGKNQTLFFDPVQLNDGM